MVYQGREVAGDVDGWLLIPVIDGHDEGGIILAVHGLLIPGSPRFMTMGVRDVGVGGVGWWCGL